MAKILIVDDSETLRAQLRKDLESAGHAVMEAVDGEDGLKKLAAHSDIRLLISDINMPKMDGLTMCSKIDRKDHFDGLKIFLLTTETSQDMKDKGKSVGVNAWITKPYNPEKLVSAIGKILN